VLGRGRPGQLRHARLIGGEQDQQGAGDQRQHQAGGQQRHRHALPAQGIAQAVRALLPTERTQFAPVRLDVRV